MTVKDNEELVELGAGVVELDAPTSLVGLASSEVLGVLVSAVWEGVGEGEKVVVSLKLECLTTY